MLGLIVSLRAKLTLIEVALFARLHGYVCVKPAGRWRGCDAYEESARKVGHVAVRIASPQLILAEGMRLRLASQAERAAYLQSRGEEA